MFDCINIRDDDGQSLKIETSWCILCSKSEAMNPVYGRSERQNKFEFSLDPASRLLVSRTRVDE